MSDYPRLLDWLRGGLISLLGGSVTLFYGVLHLGLKIPLSDLVRPFAALSVFHMLLMGAMYWVRKHQVESGGDSRPFYMVLGLYATIYWMLAVYYGIRFSFLSSEKGSEYYLFGLIFMPLVSLVAYYVNKTIRWRQHS